MNRFNSAGYACLAHLQQCGDSVDKINKGAEVLVCGPNAFKNASLVENARNIVRNGTSVPANK